MRKLDCPILFLILLLKLPREKFNDKVIKSGETASSGRFCWAVDKWIFGLPSERWKPSETIAHRYNNKAIKDTLEKETFGKCAYCESKIRHVEFGDIEHILPKCKDARPDLYVEWSNLTLACEVCNRVNKRDYYNPNIPLVNPMRITKWILYLPWNDYYGKKRQ